jgi:hypothetical protein
MLTVVTCINQDNQIRDIVSIQDLLSSQIFFVVFTTCGDSNFEIIKVLPSFRIIPIPTYPSRKDDKLKLLKTIAREESQEAPFLFWIDIESLQDVRQLPYLWVDYYKLCESGQGGWVDGDRCLGGSREMIRG